MSEANYYENPLLWTTDMYLENQEQIHRFSTCRNLIPNDVSTILDVGTGNGAFLTYLERNPPDNQTKLKLIGLERSQSAIKASMCQSEIIYASADKIPYSDQSFDLVSALEVIEHLPYKTYEKTIQEIERIAKKYILISVPYREKRVLIKCPYCGCSFQPNYHMRRFDNSKMKTLFDLFELKDISLVTIKRQTTFIAVPNFLKQDLRIIKDNFSSTALCPQCGFRKEKVNKINTEKEKRSIKQIIKDILPKRYKYFDNWIVGLYKRR